MTQHNSNDEKLARLFDLWSQQKDITQAEEAELQAHPVWAERMASFLNLESMAQAAEMEPMTVPDWNRNAGFEQYLKQPSWWQNQGLSLVAMSFSIFACVVMLFDLRMNISDSGVTVASAAQVQKQQLEQQFAQLAQQNNTQIQSRLDNFQANQQQSTAQLVTYVLNNSRIERQEDIQDMVAVIQQQRKDDLSYLKQQFSDINYNIRQAEKRKSRNLNTDDDLQISE